MILLFITQLQAALPHQNSKIFETFKTQLTTGEWVIDQPRLQVALQVARHQQNQLQKFDRIFVIGDLVCQGTQILLTFVQLSTKISEDTGIVLNSLNLVAGLLCLIKMPLYHKLQVRLDLCKTYIDLLESASQ